MKKLFLILTILTFTLINQANAIGESITGIALDEFSTQEPKEYFTLRLDTDCPVNSNLTLEEGTILHGKVVEVSNGSIGKRQGYFVFKPTHYAKDEEINEKDLNIEIKVSFYKPFDKEQAAKNLAKSGLTTVASKVFSIPLLSQGISFVKGATNPQDGNGAIRSGLKKVYDDSVLSYAKKGGPLIIQQGQEVKLTVKETY